MQIESLKPKTFAYCATVFSKHPAGLEEAFKDAARVTAALMLRGVPVFSPIAHSWPLALHGDIDPLSHDIWLPADQPLMNAASVLLVADMPGWRDSYGVAYEITCFRNSAKPVFLLNCDTLEYEVLS